MVSRTLGVKIDDVLDKRLQKASNELQRTPDWLIKQAVYFYLENLEKKSLKDQDISKIDFETSMSGVVSAHFDSALNSEYQPFLSFAQNVQAQTHLRAAITAAYRRAETACLPELIEQARMPAHLVKPIHDLAVQLTQALREMHKKRGVEALIQEFSLSTQEGVVLMCLAEALLRIPDQVTRDTLIRDKISQGDWRHHVGHSPSFFVNAATWGLLITGKLVKTHPEATLASTLSKIIRKGGEPLIRKSVDMMMRLMGEQFVSGETIVEALENSRQHEVRGFRYSYDMLGEAAMTEEDAQRYFASYEQAIHAIGATTQTKDVYANPGISIKLSALHPRYSRMQHERMMSELLPRVKRLAVLSKQYQIGLNIDAEEADRLEISLDLLEALCFDPDLADWNGMGFVVQAYQKRCPFVIDYLIDLAQRSQRRLMIRLVKGAYWDTEIKRAQVDGLEGYPVYTRKVFTDVAYLACAKKLLQAPEWIYPQFATHNAQTLSSIYCLAGENYVAGQYEFQCLHGMGEALYETVVDKRGLNRPCRIYAPVGTHETLLAYLVRRLLENGANTSFVNRIADKAISIESLIADPVKEAEAITPLGLPHEKIPLPVQLYGANRLNSAGLDLSNEQHLADLSSILMKSAQVQWVAEPLLENSALSAMSAQAVRNPANFNDCVGQVYAATDVHVAHALEQAQLAAPVWQAVSAAERAACLMRAADLLEAQFSMLLGLIVREAGKSFVNAISEIREAVDFLRFYGAQVEQSFSNETDHPLGVVVCISPWNFPLAIFIGQVAAALVAGNVVLAKPAEQTPLIAAQAVRILHDAGVPIGALQFLPGDGETVGAALTKNQAVQAVVFTGSTQVARLINSSLSQRLNAQGKPVVLIAETGGQNAMIVDSSALPEQVVADVLLSAFDSAGQRCSALRVLCIQEDVADRVLHMLKGAMQELRLGNPDQLSIDVGPVIDLEAKENIDHHIQQMKEKGFSVTQLPLSEAAQTGYFVPPTLIELPEMGQLKQEIFGPVLHVIRYQRNQLPKILDEIKATGYGLTLGLHTRIDETIAYVLDRAHVGNVYVNRNMIGAVVGVQPFGGEGLSGTGPKAGGPLYLSRLLAQSSSSLQTEGIAGLDFEFSAEDARAKQAVDALANWLVEQGQSEYAQKGKALVADVRLGSVELAGPTGERNIYHLAPRGVVLCMGSSVLGTIMQWFAALATGNVALSEGEIARQLAQHLPASLQKLIHVKPLQDTKFDAVLFEGEVDELLKLTKMVAQLPGPIIAVQSVKTGAFASKKMAYTFERLLHEQSVSVNTTAAGGNANLMTM